MMLTSQTRSVDGHDQPTRASRFSQYGLPLARPILRALEKRGIYCLTGVSIEHQHLAKRYVLRGTESGGAVSDMGRYCAYLDSEGIPLPWLQPLDGISGNGRHAIVIAQELVRAEMLRIGRTYELAISRHSLSEHVKRTRPSIESSLLFRGRQGTLAIDLWKDENRSLRGTIAPVFYSPAGEIRPIPEHFDQAVRKLTGALACIGCKSAQIAVAPAVAMETEL